MPRVHAAPSSTASLSAVLVSAPYKVARRVYGIWTAIANRQSVKALEGFDDFMLADIGLTRDDLREAFDAPLLADPTLRLAAISGDRSADMTAVARPRRRP